MTAPDELNRAAADLKWELADADQHKWMSVTVDAEDLRLLLSERAELLATVERMREELDVVAVHLQIAGGWLREAGDDGQRTKELLRASNRARAALTGEGE